MDRTIRCLRRRLVALGFGIASAMSIAPAQATLCGGVNYPFPYTDVSGVGAPFCPGIMEAYVTGVSKGTSPTTFSPNELVPRLQMTTFLQRSLDQGLARTSKRAALNQWWTPRIPNATQTIFVGPSPQFCAADGEHIWISESGNVEQVQASTGAPNGYWYGAGMGGGVLIAAGKVFVAGGDSVPGTLYVIDPTQPPGAITLAAGNLGNNPFGIAFDGIFIWTANRSGSVSIISPQATTPYPVFTITTGFNSLSGILFDGTNIWVADAGADTLLRLNPFGVILQTVTVGVLPGVPAFDGTNIWVPNNLSDSITVVQASTGNVVATIAADANNKLDGPETASFDGERILVTNVNGNSVTLFKAADLSFIANVQTGGSTAPYGACSDGINFWVTLSGTGILAANLMRF